MNSRRFVWAAVLGFLASWGVLATLALSKVREDRSDLHGDAPAAIPAHQVVSRAEVAAHNRPEDCWLVIRGKVYDVTDYLPSHPAPSRAIGDYCGEESTWAFETKERNRPHSPRAQNMLDTYLIGEVTD